MHEMALCVDYCLLGTVPRSGSTLGACPEPCYVITILLSRRRLGRRRILDSNLPSDPFPSVLEYVVGPHPPSHTLLRFDYSVCPLAADVRVCNQAKHRITSVRTRLMLAQFLRRVSLPGATNGRSQEWRLRRERISRRIRRLLRQEIDTALSSFTRPHLRPPC